MFKKMKAAFNEGRVCEYTLPRVYGRETYLIVAYRCVEVCILDRVVTFHFVLQRENAIGIDIEWRRAWKPRKRK